MCIYVSIHKLYRYAVTQKVVLSLQNDLECLYVRLREPTQILQVCSQSRGHTKTSDQECLCLPECTQTCSYAVSQKVTLTPVTNHWNFTIRLWHHVSDLRKACSLSHMPAIT